MDRVVAEFYEILHVHRNGATRYRPEHTVFSFIGKDGYVPYVTVPGSPPLRAGMKVVALLRQPGDWKSLVGWLDISTRQIAAPDVKDAHIRWIGTLLFSLVFAGTLLAAIEPSFSLPAVGLVLLAAAPLYLAYKEYLGWVQAKMESAAVAALESENEA